MNAEANDDEVLRSYLLGRLAQESRESVEKRLFSEDRIFLEHVGLVEEELIDQYARGDMDGEDSASFERNFLCTDERRAKLELALALRAYAERRQTVRARPWGWLRRPVSSPAWALAVAATLFLALPAVVWRLAATRGPQAEVSAWLSSGLVRDVGGELARVRTPPGCRLVRLRLDPEGAEYPTYRATLHEVNGDEIWSQSRLVADRIGGREAVTVTLPCELLPAGDYYVRLSGVPPDHDPIVLGRYDVRVLRR